VAVLESGAGVPAGPEVGVTAVTGKTDERPGEREPVALGDPSGATDVPACALVVALDRRVACEFPQPLDALAGDLLGAHRLRVGPTRPYTLWSSVASLAASSLARDPAHRIPSTQAAPTATSPPATPNASR